METREIRKKVRVLLESYHEKLAEAMQKKDTPKEFYFAENLVENGNEMVKCKCLECGREWKSKKNCYIIRNTTCPGCGKRKDIFWYGEKKVVYEKEFFVLEDSEELLVMAEYRPTFVLLYTHSNWMDNNFVPATDTDCYPMYDIICFVYDKKKETYVFLNLMDNKLLTVKMYSTKYRKNMPVLETTLKKLSMTDMLERVQAAEIKLKTDESSKKILEENIWKTEALDKMGTDFQPIPEEEIRELVKRKGEFSAIVLQNNALNKTDRIYCHNCGKIFDIKTSKEKPLNPEVECPCCHEQGTYQYIYNDRHFFIKLEKWNDGLCARVFKNSLSQNGENIISRFEEIERHLFDMKDHYILTASKQGWERVHHTSYYAYRTEKLINDNEIKEIIAGSCFAKTGYIEALGLGDNEKCMCDNIAAIAEEKSYLSIYIKNPNFRNALEKLVKAGFSEITKELMFDISFKRKNITPKINTTAEDVFGILGVSKCVGRNTRTHMLSFDRMLKFEKLYNRHPLEYEMFEKMEDINYELDVDFLELLDRLNISYKRVIEYMDNVYDYQCIERDEAFRIWMDYLRMAVTLHYDLKDNSRKFPTSLKKEHDVVVFAFNRLEREHKEQIFKEVSKQNQYLEYTKKEDAYFIKVPEIPEDIIEEATQQKNCVRSYIERISNGSTIVCFLRKKEEPDKSFGTIEVKGGRIIQLKGYCNSTIRDKKAIQFIQDWAKNKKIAVNC